MDLEVIVIVWQGVEDGGSHESNRPEGIGFLPRFTHPSERRPRQCLCDSQVVLAVSLPQPLSIRAIYCAPYPRILDAFILRRPPKVRLGTARRNHVLINLDVSPASVSPFSEPTSPNPAIITHAETTEALHTYGTYLMQCLPKFIQQFSVYKDELTLYVAPSAVIPVLIFLRDHSQCQFKSCVDISGADYPERDKRFEVVYHLLSFSQAGRIRVKTYAGEASAVPSAVPIFRGADWYSLPLFALHPCFDPILGMSVKLGTYSAFSSRATQTCTCRFNPLYSCK